MRVRLLQWNAWYKEDIQSIVRFLKAQTADIICLQELTIDDPDQKIKHAPRFVAEQLGYNYSFKELPIESTDGSSLMLANGIFTRFPIVNKNWAWINRPTGSGGYDDEYRAYVEAVLDVDGHRLCVATTHMSYTHRFEITPNKQAETDKLASIIRQHKSDFVFCGDLNALPGSYTIKSIEQTLTSLGPGEAYKTWTTKPFSYNGFEEDKLNWRLDYVFATPEVQAVSAEVLKTSYSDHLPILVELDI